MSRHSFDHDHYITHILHHACIHSSIHTYTPTLTLWTHSALHILSFKLNNDKHCQSPIFQVCLGLVITIVFNIDGRSHCTYFTQLSCNFAYKYNLVKCLHIHTQSFKQHIIMSTNSVIFTFSTQSLRHSVIQLTLHYVQGIEESCACRFTWHNTTVTLCQCTFLWCCHTWRWGEDFNNTTTMYFHYNVLQLNQSRTECPLHCKHQIWLYMYTLTKRRNE